MGAVYWYSMKVEDGGKVLKDVIQEYNPTGYGQTLLSQTTGVHSVKDIYYSQNAKTITIRFGDYEFALDKSVIVTRAMQNNLQKLDIKMQVRSKEDLTINIFYKGEKVKEVVD